MIKVLKMSLVMGKYLKINNKLSNYECNPIYIHCDITAPHQTKISFFNEFINLIFKFSFNRHQNKHKNHNILCVVQK